MTTSSPLTPNITILIVDDSAEDRATYLRHLRSDISHSYVFLEAETLAEGIYLWRSQHPDIVLVDYFLPDGEGWELLAAMGKGDLVPKLDAIVLTGHDGNEQIILQTMRLGAADYLVKGQVTSVSLCTRVGQVCDHLILTRKLQRSQEQELLIAQISLHIRQYISLEEILNAIVQEIRAFLKADRTIVYQFNPDFSGLVVAESVLPPWKTSLNQRIDEFCFQGNLGQSYAEGCIFATSDIYKASLTECHLQLLEKFQVRANLVLPILIINDKTPKLWGLLIVHQCSDQRIWQQSEISLLQQLSVQLAIAIQQAELYRDLQTSNAELENRVAERTTELFKRQIALQESNRRWQSLLDNVRLIVVGLNCQGQVEYVNPYFLEATGYVLEEVMGKDWFTNFLPQLPSAQISLDFADSLVNDFRTYYQNSIVTKVKEEKEISWNNTLLRNESGEIMGTLGIGEDITEKLKVERVKNEFISIVSHELRTPLSSIRGALGLLASGVLAQKPEVAKNMLNIATIDIERLVRLVNDILDLERLASHNVRLYRQWHDTTQLCRQAVETMQEIATASQIQIIDKCSSFQIFADGDRLVQTLVNLLSNAIKFSPPQSQIEIRIESGTEEVVFHVSDRGRGIPSNHLESIFERFNQVDASDSRQLGGTGLGLAICQSIVQQHGGKIWTESKLSEGSTFSFTIPHYRR
ncbi:ATP-binding protein [Pseudanabaena mucicola]|uniref:histidine kinase n=1 Tax=Pseudanabaena mucicola FACHB-723 TaxID=2692860 RepID=A0ABR7ZW14_9CYAN|nr:ATP-binding protein [Pseudanabaena mucicola]MBD2187665.1 GAF domain-containing protein [Pseudanabaena mucicola FACHB-723]